MSTTKEQREKLVRAGFVRVDGLRTYRPGPDAEETYIINADVHHRGHHDYNNGLSVIVTIGAEVWLASGPKEPERLFRELCPNGVGAFVPCSNGETLSHHDLLARVGDPDYTPCYAAKATAG